MDAQAGQSAHSSRHERLARYKTDDTHRRAAAVAASRDTPHVFVVDPSLQEEDDAAQHYSRHSLLASPSTDTELPPVGPVSAHDLGLAKDAGGALIQPAHYSPSGGFLTAVPGVGAQFTSGQLVALPPTWHLTPPNTTISLPPPPNPPGITSITPDYSHHSSVEASPPPFGTPGPAADPGAPGAGAPVEATGRGAVRLPPILQVEKQHVTTTATQAASASRRRNDAIFKCPVPGCGSTFTRRFNLRGHLRSHTEERPFVCGWPGCGKGFARSHDCKRHTALHTAKPGTHQCQACGKTFSRQDALNRHLKSDGAAQCREILSSEGGARLVSKSQSRSLSAEAGPGVDVSSVLSMTATQA